MKWILCDNSHSKCGCLYVLKYEAVSLEKVEYKVTWWSWIASILAIAVPQVPDPKIPILFIITGWSYLFAIGASIPPISGIIISCLENNLRGDGFSFCNLIINLIGSFPSSYVYSLLADAFKSKGEQAKLQYAWMFSMGYNFVGLIFVIISGIFRYAIKGDLSENNEEIKESNKTETENGGETSNGEKYENV